MSFSASLAPFFPTLERWRARSRASGRPTFAQNYLNRTFGIFFLVAGLTMFGLVMVYSASAAIVASNENRAAARRTARLMESLPREERQRQEALGRDTPSYHSGSVAKKQAANAILGFAGLFLCYAIDYQFWRRWARRLLAVAVVLLVCVWVPGLGKKVNGASRWINLRVMNVQASEVAKLAMVIYLANWMAANRKQVKSFKKGFVPLTLTLGVVAALIVKEPDLGATACLGVIALTIFFVGGMRLSHLSLLLLGAAAVVSLELMVPFRRARLLAFLDPETYAQTHAWQLQQSLIAMGSGGVWGLGLGAGPQKYLFLSEAYTDFVYAVIGEEFGMAGALAVAACFVALCWLGLAAAWKAPDLNGTLVAAGVTSMFGVSAFIHMGVNSGLLPTKGLTLPFISGGSSSLLVNLAAAGILMNVSKQAEIHARQAGDLPPEEAPPLFSEPASRPSDAPRKVIVRRAGQSKEAILPPSRPNP
jgi:cell division protein FtsW